MYTQNRSDENLKMPKFETEFRSVKSKQQLPDAKMHQIISFIKSGVRLIGYGLLPFNLIAAVAVLIFSEVIGILEELV